MDTRKTRSLYLFGRRFGNIKTLSTSQKLWLGFGGLTAFIALVCVVILLRMYSLGGFLNEQAMVNRPRTMTTLAMETNAFDYAMAVRSHPQEGGAEIRRYAEEASEKVDHYLSKYSAFTKTDLQRQLHARFATLWQELKDQGQALLDDKNPPDHAESLKKFQSLHLGMEQFLNTEMQPDATNILNAQWDQVVQYMRANQGFLMALLTGGIVLGGFLSLVIGSAITKENNSLLESQALLQKIIEKTAIPTMLHDGTKVLIVNEAWTILSGYRFEDIPTINDWKGRAQVKSAGFNLDFLNTMIGSTDRVDHGESVLTTADGQWRTWRFYTTPLTMESDGRCLLLCHAMDVTGRQAASDQSPVGEKGYRLPDQKQAQKLAEYRHQLDEVKIRMESISNTDPLTHLHNRRALQEKLADEVKRTARYGLPLSLLLVDVDQFQQLNGKIDKPATEEVLRDVGQLLGETTRTTDFAARYGSEEFAILLPGTGRKGAAISAEKIRKAVEEEKWPGKNITVSVGVATLTAGYGDGSELMEQADTALYHGKKNGTNRVHVATGEDTLPLAMW